MNINTEKQNLFPFHVEQEGYSPYLSPLLANNNSKDFEDQEQLINFHLNDVQVKDENYQQKENEEDLNLDLLNEHKSTPQQQLMELNSQSLQTVEKKPVFSVGKKDSSKIYSIINFLVQNDELNESEIKQSGKKLYQQSPMLEYIFSVMLGKLKKLRKTKQQMTKFCMRKAFKFVSDNQSQSRKKRKNSKQDPQSENLSFEMPFRKNSTQKTMNTQFLKQVFSKSAFVHQYERFLQDFREIILRDNEYKIKYLSQTIEQHVNSNNIKKIEQIKRLPWTRSILNKTQQLAFSLLKFADAKDQQSEQQLIKQ